MSKNEVSIYDFLLEIKSTYKFLISKWKIIILISFIGAVIGLMTSILLKPKYVSTLKFVIDEDKKGGGGLASLASSFGLGGISSDNSLFSSSNIIEFLKTRSMVEETMLRPINEEKYKNKTFVDLYIKKNGFKEKWAEIPELSKIKFKVGEDRSKFSRIKDSILGIIYNGFVKDYLKVTQPNEDNSIIQIEVTSRSEVFSKNFPLELINVASKYYSDSKTSKAKNSVDILQKQVDSVKMELYKSMGSAAISNDDVFGLNPAMNIQRIPSAKQQAQVKVNAIVLEELVKNLEISKMNLLNDTPIINIIDKPIYPLYVDKLRKIKGIFFGGLILGSVTVLFLISKRYITNLNNKNK